MHLAFLTAIPIPAASPRLSPALTATRPTRLVVATTQSSQPQPPSLKPIIPTPHPISSGFNEDDTCAPEDIVLTHATADFDSLAAAVALAKLRGPHCRVVLPAGAHPSVRRYLSLHKSFFPIVDAKVVDPTRIRWLGVVDTTSPTRLGNASEWLSLAEHVVVLDHHDHGHPMKTPVTPPQDLAAVVTGALDVIVEPVGAATTLAVERLMARPDLELTRAEATLFALAIHTDTGSLTYESTTPRDAHALAWLMSCGACQRSVSQFSRLYLDGTQQRLLTNVLDGLTVRNIHGHSLAVAVLQTDNFVPGMSVVAQTALDLAGLDALLLAVVTPGRKVRRQGEGGAKANEGRETVHLALIGRARARVDGVHFGEVFGALGGGGHAKAASASVRVAVEDVDAVVDEVFEQVTEQLPPAVLAKDFMSREVVCVTPGQTMEEAKGVLFESGHTGLAVVQSAVVQSEDGKELIGVISRQDVALAERRGKLQTPVSGWVSRKVLSVEPNTPLHVVEATLVDNDVGRLPVVHDGKVVGIVTRSDVLLQRRLGSPEVKLI